VSIRIRSLVDLSVMKRRPVAVAQTFAAADVCCVSFLLAVGAGLGTVLRPVSEALVVLVPAGC
jgi:uncharacterized membrane protein YczE